MPTKPRPLGDVSKEILEQVADELIEAETDFKYLVLAIHSEDSKKAMGAAIDATMPVTAARRAVDALLDNAPKRALQILEKARKAPKRPGRGH